MSDGAKKVRVERGDLKIFPGSASVELTKRICMELGINQGDVALKNFSDGEHNLQFLESLRDNDVFIVNSTISDQEILRTILLIRAAVGASAKRVTAVFPYSGYNRQDRKDRPRTPSSAKVIADMIIRAMPHRVLLLDLHSATTADFYDGSCQYDHLESLYVNAGYLKEKFKGKNLVVAAPDVGGVKRARAYANKLGCRFVILDKVRSGPNEIKKDSMTVIGDVEDADVLIIDDIIDTARTLANAAEALLKKGAKSVSAFGIHAVLSGDAVDRINHSQFERVIVTDTIHHSPEKFLTGGSTKIEVVSVAPLITEAISRLHYGESLSPLFA